MTPRALPCACGCGSIIAPDHVGARVSGDLWFYDESHLGAYELALDAREAARRRATDLLPCRVEGCDEPRVTKHAMCRKHWNEYSAARARQARSLAWGSNESGGGGMSVAWARTRKHGKASI